MVVEQLPARPAASQNSSGSAAVKLSGDYFALREPAASAILEETLTSTPQLAYLRQDLMRAYTVLARCFQTGGTLFLAGNGGSMADALHISGELDKAYKKRRRIPAQHQARLVGLSGGVELAESLQAGLRSVVLGINPALASAIENDFRRPHMGLAQELYALGRSGDAFLGISTSGDACNIQYAVSVARLLGLPTILLTGESGGALAEQAGIILKAPARETPVIQTWHIRIYHCLCEMLEAQAFCRQEAS
jgi:D-sedoheptulose 7-phosphate isomerase